MTTMNEFVDVLMASCALAALLGWTAYAGVRLYTVLARAWRRKGSEILVRTQPGIEKEYDENGRVTAYVIRCQLEMIPGQHIRNIDKALDSAGISHANDDGKD